MAKKRKAILKVDLAKGLGEIETETLDGSEFTMGKLVCTQSGTTGAGQVIGIYAVHRGSGSKTAIRVRRGLPIKDAYGVTWVSYIFYM